jgi:hypothetical protein
MIKIDDEKKENSELKISKNEKILNLIYHVNSDSVEGNKNKISIHEIFITTYAKLVGLNISKTKSYSPHHSNILLETLPMVSYGINYSERNKVSKFLKEITNINTTFNFKTPVSLIHSSEKLEKIILTDLQLFLNLINYFNYHQETPLWKKILNYIYQPRESLYTYLKDRRVLNKTCDVFSSDGYQEVIYFYLKRGYLVYQGNK